MSSALSSIEPLGEISVQTAHSNLQSLLFIVCTYVKYFVINWFRFFSIRWDGFFFHFLATFWLWLCYEKKGNSFLFVEYQFLLCHQTTKFNAPLNTYILQETLFASIKTMNWEVNEYQNHDQLNLVQTNINETIVNVHVFRLTYIGFFYCLQEKCYK